MAKQLNLNGKSVFIVEKHHEVLEKWEECNNTNMITFDFHTDTLSSFLHYLYKNNHNSSEEEISKMSSELIEGFIQKKLSIKDIIKILKHDEHIDFAVKSKLINTAFVVSHVGSGVHSLNDRI